MLIKLTSFNGKIQKKTDLYMYYDKRLEILILNVLMLFTLLSVICCQPPADTCSVRRGVLTLNRKICMPQCGCQNGSAE